MRGIFSVLSLVLTLAALVAAPAQESSAAVSAVTAPVMRMDDGKGCPQQGCAKMPDCARMVPGLTGISAFAAEVA